MSEVLGVFSAIYRGLESVLGWLRNFEECFRVHTELVFPGRGSCASTWRRARSNNDIDGICRLIEWGADINLKDHKKRTPLHFASMGGYMPVRRGGRAITRGGNREESSRQGTCQ